jgi:crotonobetainyl-CoA:carnitine CoA-transferase CaiB-like acyl-CoA transferase
MEENGTTKEALDDLKVIDFGWAIAAPTLCWFLATHGATVIRIESNKRPDVYRVSAPYKDGKPGVNRAGFFAYPNVNKLSIALDLTQTKGIAIAKKLIAWADVVVDNFRVGPMEKWGLSYEDIRKIKPDIIMLRTTNQGLTGPYNKQAGWGWQLVGLTGISNIGGWPDREPLSLGMPYTDVIAPRFGIAALMAALVHREKTGEGQLIDLSQLETSIHFIGPTMLNYFANNEEGKRMGNASPNAAPHGVYRCKGDDRWCAISVFTDEEWRGFCKALGNPIWTEDPKFKLFLNRKKNEEELNILVEKWTSQHPAESVMSLLQNEGVPAGVVQNGQNIYEDPQLNYRNYFWTMDHPEMGAFAHLGQPFGLSETPAKPRMPAPCLGEHNEYICTNILGMSDEEFVDALSSGVLE